MQLLVSSYFPISISIQTVGTNLSTVECTVFFQCTLVDFTTNLVTVNDVFYRLYLKFCLALLSIL